MNKSTQDLTPTPEMLKLHADHLAAADNDQYEMTTEDVLSLQIDDRVQRLFENLDNQDRIEIACYVNNLVTELLDVFSDSVRPEFAQRALNYDAL